LKAGFFNYPLAKRIEIDENELQALARGIKTRGRS
jgi:hypothetical protein